MHLFGNIISTSILIYEFSFYSLFLFIFRLKGISIVVLECIYIYFKIFITVVFFFLTGSGDNGEIVINSVH